MTLNKILATLGFKGLSNTAAAKTVPVADVNGNLDASWFTALDTRDSALAQVYYIAPDGAAGNTGSSGSPLATLADVPTTAAAIAVVYAPGTYGSQTLSTGVTTNITLRGEGKVQLGQVNVGNVITTVHCSNIVADKIYGAMTTVIVTANSHTSIDATGSTCTVTRDGSSTITVADGDCIYTTTLTADDISYTASWATLAANKIKDALDYIGAQLSTYLKHDGSVETTGPLAIGNGLGVRYPSAGGVFNTDLVAAEATANNTATLPNATGEVTLQGQVIPVAAGGTGATTVETALVALGLDQVEPTAKDDMTKEEIKTALESNADTNTVTDAEKDAISTIEPVNAATVEAAGAVMDADFSEDLGHLVKTSTGTYKAVKYNISSLVDPTADDDSTEGWSVLSRWYNLSSPTVVFECVDATEGAARWIAIAAANDPDAVANLTRKSTLDANSIYKADEDDVPVKLDIPVSTVVGRNATGSIAALTIAELKVLTSTLTEAEIAALLTTNSTTDQAYTDTKHDTAIAYTDTKHTAAQAYAKKMAIALG